MTSSELINAATIERTISAVAGTVLLGTAVRRGGLTGFALGALGLGLVTQAVRGSPSLARRVRPEALEIQKAITIEAPASELYAFWRDFENVPRFMTHIASVRKLDEVRSEWTAVGPGNRRIRWRAEVTEERPNEMISWRSVDKSPIDQRGTVRFVPSPQEGSTEVHLQLEYAAPSGTVGIIVGKLLVGLTALKMQEDLRHLKQLYETGSIPTVDGQPHGKRGRVARLAERLKQRQLKPRGDQRKLGARGEVQV